MLARASGARKVLGSIWHLSARKAPAFIGDRRRGVGFAGAPRHFKHLRLLRTLEVHDDRVAFRWRKWILRRSTLFADLGGVGPFALITPAPRAEQRGRWTATARSRRFSATSALPSVVLWDPRGGLAREWPMHRLGGALRRRRRSPTPRSVAFAR